MATRRLKLLSANIQAGSSTRGYHDYVARSWSHVLPAASSDHLALSIELDVPVQALRAA